MLPFFFLFIFYFVFYFILIIFFFIFFFFFFLFFFPFSFSNFVLISLSQFVGLSMPSWLKRVITPLEGRIWRCDFLGDCRAKMEGIEANQRKT